jgi:hypothetical protein
LRECFFEIGISIFSSTDLPKSHNCTDKLFMSRAPKS